MSYYKVTRAIVTFVLFLMVLISGTIYSQAEDCSGKEDNRCGGYTSTPEQERCYPEVTNFEVKIIKYEGYFTYFSIGVSGSGFQQGSLYDSRFSVSVSYSSNFDDPMPYYKNLELASYGCGVDPNASGCVECNNNSILWVSAAPVGTQLKFRALARQQIDYQNDGCECAVYSEVFTIPPRNIPDPGIYFFSDTATAYETGVASCNVIEGNPINVSNGNKYLVRQDALIKNDFAFPISFTKYYNSFSSGSGDLGSKWSHSFEYELTTNPSEDTIILIMGDSKNIIFTNNTIDGEYHSQFGENYRLDILIDGSEKQYIFSDENNLKYVFYENSSTLSDGFHYLVSNVGDTISYINNIITDPSGRQMELVYDVNNRLDHILDGNSDTLVIYEYNPVSSLLDKTIYPDGSYEEYYYEDIRTGHEELLTKITNSDGYIYNYVYDDNNLAVASYGDTITLDGMTLQNINRLDVDYSLIETSSPDSFYFNSLVSYNVDGDTSGTSFYQSKWDPRYIKRFLIESTNSSCSSCGTEYDYDGFGNIKDLIHKNGTKDSLKFDRRGNIVYQVKGINSSDPQYKRIEYDTTINLPVKIYYPSLVSPDPDQWDTLFFEYQNSKLAKIKSIGWINDTTTYLDSTTYRYNANGLLEHIDGPRSDVADTVRFEYYANGDLKYQILPNGDITEIGPKNALGQISYTISPNQDTTLLFYDGRGRLNRIIVGDTTSPNSYRESKFSYNFSNNLTTYVNPENDTTKLYYAGNYNWLDSVVNSSGETIRYGHDINSNANHALVCDASGVPQKEESFEYDFQSRLTKAFRSNGTDFSEYTYNTSGLVETITDPNGVVQTIVYDDFKRILETQQIINNETLKTKYEYDTHNNLTQVIDADDNIYEFYYDDRGNLIKETSDIYGTCTYEYDPASNLISKTDANDNTITYTYDALNRIKTITYETNKVNEYFYDGAGDNSRGRLDSVLCTVGTTLESKTAYTYDNWGRVLSVNNVIDGLDETTYYTYNKNDQVEKMTYPSGIEILYGYNDLGQAINILWKQPSDQAWTNLIPFIRYEPFGPEDSILYHNMYFSTIVYSEDYQVESLKTKIFMTANKIIDKSYTYHPEGNVNTIADNFNFDTVTYSYTYDDFYNLESASSVADTNINHFFTYNPNGNIASITIDQTLDTFYYSENKLDSVVGSDLIEYTYDSNGNITSITTNSTATTTYQYDGLNRLLSIDHDSTASYRYNHLSQRIKKSISGDNDYYIYSLDGNLISEFETEEDWDVEYVYLNGNPIAMFRIHQTGGITSPPPPDSGLGELPLMTIMGGSIEDPLPDPDPDPDPDTTTITPFDMDVFYYHNDHLGTPLALTDENGTVRWETDYYPFGQIYNANFNIRNNIRFPGQYEDEESDNHYNWHRYYQPEFGRYLTPDPIGLAGGLNPYSYAGNNPINYIDPMGLKTYLILYGKGEMYYENKGLTGDVGLNFYEAAKTRASEIENSKIFNSKEDQVIMVSTPTVEDFISAFNECYESGEIAGIDIYSHGWPRGLNLGGSVEKRKDIRHVKGTTLPKLSPNLSVHAYINLYGCSTAAPVNSGKNIAQLFANKFNSAIISAYNGPSIFEWRDGKTYSVPDKYGVSRIFVFPER